MKIIALSDLHIDEKPKESSKTIEDILKKKSDVLLIGGDIGRTKAEIQKVLSKFETYDAIKLAYLGNHEISAIENSNIGNHYQELNELFKKNNFHLLDYAPFQIQNIVFIGNSGWFDFTLFKGDNFDAQSQKALEHYHNKYETGNKTPQEFTQECIQKIKTQIDATDKNAKIILGIHHIAFSEMLKYRYSELYDFKNLFMGSNKLKELYENPKVIAGFCGHNHRSAKITFQNKPIYNISTDEKQPYLELDI